MDGPRLDLAEAAYSIGFKILHFCKRLDDFKTPGRKCEFRSSKRQERVWRSDRNVMEITRRLIARVSARC